MRLAQFLSKAGISSRRAAQRLIDAGKVTVNGQVADQLTFVDGHETIIADGQPALLPQQYQYLLYNKPVGVECVCDPTNPDSIVNQLPLPSRLFPVGRLDKDSHGLLLLTNDGQLCHRLLSPLYDHPKRYLVRVQPHYGRGDCDQNFFAAMAQGVEIKGQLTKPCGVTALDTNYFAITLTQGLNRQIRRMAQSLGYLVVDLQRVSIVNLQLAELKVGQCRAVNEAELVQLQLLIQSSLD